MHTYIKTFRGLAWASVFSLVSLNATAQEVDSVGTPAQVRVVTGPQITGRITQAATGEALPGVSVAVPEFSSAFTDDNGNFTITVPSGNATLVVTGAGFQQKQVAVKGRSAVEVSLYEENFNSVYDEAFLPRGRKPLSQTVGSVVSSNMPNKYGQALENPDSYLQGQVAGLNVIRRSGTPGVGANMFLRGFSSINATNRPLVVVDGMIYDMNEEGNTLINNYSTNPLNHIDLRDIENITFIKDATSMYGSKAANGVILITTAFARDLATRIDFSAYAGLNTQPSAIPTMNAGQYRTYLSDVLKSQGLSDEDIQSRPYMSDDPSMPGYHTYHNDTDWQKEVMRNAITNNYYLKVSGGDNIAKYALSVGYLNQQGVVAGTSLDRYNTRFNGDYQISPKLSANSRLAFTYSENTLKEEGIAPKTNPVYLGLVKSPLLHTNEMSSEGLVSPNLADTDIFNFSNPRTIVENANFRNSNYRFFGSVNANYDFTKNLRLSSLFGLTYDKVRENTFIPRKGVLADTLSNAVAYSRMGSMIQRLFSIYNDTRVSYDRNFGQVHSLGAIAGLRYQFNQSEYDYGLGYNSATDELQTIGTGVNALRRTGGGLGQWTWLSYYAGVDYGLMNKYFLSANVSVDGSSRFGKQAKNGIDLFDNKFGVFPSVGAAWVISSENFMAGINAIELLKLRASYGLTGNDDIGNYSSKQLYVSQNLLGLQGLVRANIANPALQWETNRKLNLGLDLALFNERVSLTVDAYQSVTENMLTYEPLPPIAGFPNMLSNGGSMENKGIEVALNSRILNGGLKWDLGLTYAMNRNQVTALPTDNMMVNFGGATVLTRVGQPAGLFYGYRTYGVYATNEEAEGANRKTKLPDGTLAPFMGGDVRFEDPNMDGIINDQDRQIIGNPNPDFFGMVRNRLEYKRLSLDAIVTFSYGNDIYNYTRAQLESMSGAENQTLRALNRWRVNGQETEVPRATWGDPLGNARFSDRWIEDGSYLRLRTLTLSYALPLKTEHIKYANVYVTGNNLFTLTNYLGYDPEFSASPDARFQGIDTGMVPQFRSILAGVRFGL